MRSFSLFSGATRLVALTTILAITSCGRQESDTTDTPAPLTGAASQTARDSGVDWTSLGPVESLEQMADGMSRQRLTDLWEMMPGSYREEMNDLLEQFADKLDPEVYEQWTTMMNKAVEVLGEKRSMLTSTTLAIGLNVPDPDRFADRVDGMIDLAALLMDSDVGSYDTFRGMDIGEFLAQTGPGLERLRPEGDRGGPLAELRNADFELVSQDQDRAVVKVEGGANSGERELELVRVEQRWMPADVVDNWDRGMGRAREMLERMDFDEYRMSALTAISAMDSTLDSIAGAEDEIELAEILEFSGRLGRGRRSSDE